MDGLTFYWVTWIIWILATFFMKKGRQLRFYLSLGILLLIISSPLTLSILGMELSFASVILLFTSITLIATFKRKKAAYMMVSSFILMLAYVCFQLFELFDPVWVFLPRNWMLSFLLIALTLLLHNDSVYRIAILLLGSIQGDILYGYILNQYTFPYIIGSYVYLDTVALTFALLLVWLWFEKMITFFEKYLFEVEKEKHKLS